MQRDRMANRFTARLLLMLLIIVSIFNAQLIYAEESDKPSTESDNNYISDIEVNKTATPLDENLETVINLTFPGKEMDMAADVVFVLDKSGMSAEKDIFDQAKEFVNNLSEQAIEKDIEIRVGVVLFNNVGNITLGLTDVRTGKDDIINAMNRSLQMGTNLHAGLLAGKKLLDDDNTVPDNRKHMVVMSDGATYLWCKNDDYRRGYTRSFGNPLEQNPEFVNSWDRQGGIWEYQSRDYNVKTVEDEWRKYAALEYYTEEGLTARLKEAKERNANYEQYDYEYNLFSAYVGYGRKVTPIEPEAIANVEVAHFMAVDLFDEIDEKYNTWTYYLDIADYDGSYLMDYLKRNSGGLSTDFADIQKQILSFIDKGSMLEDFIGKDFDFVNDPSKISLMVGEESLSAIPVSGNEYGFGENEEGEYRFKLLYEPGDNEKITLSINEAVRPSAPVTLQYSEKLVNVPTEPGAYEFDTNEEAKLKIVNSDEEELGEKDFPRPKVTYEAGKVVATYIDIDTGEEIDDSAIQYGRTGKNYSTEQKEIPDYTFVKVEGDATGQFTNEIIEVIYYYKKNAAPPATDDPEDPEDPEDPGDPEVPADPEEPATPDEPTTPSNPEEPKEEVKQTPPKDKPSDAGPANTKKADGVKSDSPKEKTPPTGDTKVIWFWVVLLALTAAMSLRLHIGEKK